MEFNLQRFAEGGEGGENQSQTPPATENNETQGDEQKQEQKPEVDIDAKIAEAVAKAQKTFEETLKKREAAAKKEAELSQLSDDERQKAELENTRKELETRQAEFEREKLKYEMTKVLAERNLPVEFTDFLIAEDNEKTLERIKTFEKKYKKAIEDAVNEKLKGKTPPAGGGQSADVSKSIKNGFMQAIYDNQVKR